MDFELKQPPEISAIEKKPPDKGDEGYPKALKNGMGVEEPQVISFRDKVFGKLAPPRREKQDLVAAKIVRIELVQDNGLMPMLHVEKDFIEELSVPWKDALIVKLLGKTLGFNMMKAKLTSVWKLMSGFEIMNVGNGYFMVKFDAEADKAHVINIGGPWMIFDHYLSVRLWTPDFNSDHAVIDKTLEWVRIPSLNVLYYDETFLMAIASAIGKPIKVDLHTLRVEKCRFARVCVEVDLNLPVVGKVGVTRQWFRVEYEGLHIICANCGCYGHLLKDCFQKFCTLAVDSANTGSDKDLQPAMEKQNGKDLETPKSQVTVNDGILL